MRFPGVAMRGYSTGGGVTLQGFQESLSVEDQSSDRSEEIETWRIVLAGSERCVPSLFVLICACSNRTKRTPELVANPYPCQEALEKSTTPAPLRGAGAWLHPERWMSNFVREFSRSITVVR